MQGPTEDNEAEKQCPQVENPIWVNSPMAGQETTGVGDCQICLTHEPSEFAGERVAEAAADRQLSCFGDVG